MSSANVESHGTTESLLRTGICERVSGQIRSRVMKCWIIANGTSKTPDFHYQYSGCVVGISNMDEECRDC